MQDTNTVTLVLNEGDTNIIDVDVDGYPPHVMTFTRISGDSTLPSSLSASMLMINIINISRADAGVYKSTYINSVGFLELILNLVINCKFYDHKILTCCIRLQSENIDMLYQTPE